LKEEKERDRSKARPRFYSDSDKLDVMQYVYKKVMEGLSIIIHEHFTSLRYLELPNIILFRFVK